MRFPAQNGRFLLLICLVVLPAAGQEERAASNVTTSAMRGDAYQQRSNVRLLTRAQGVEIARVAMNSRHPLSSQYDCSHFVHGLYRKAGFPYEYAPSSTLYTGVPQFWRVSSPQPGDVAVWR